ncbi:hypothetical protein EDB86DRAFT_3246462 [Lactarius hatsudake]|nr:hypothetical protein EDB86DRAFT_3246462 [Lactarius hatsudake]
MTNEHTPAFSRGLARGANKTHTPPSLIQVERKLEFALFFNSGLYTVILRARRILRKARATRRPGARPTPASQTQSPSKRNVVVNADTVNLTLLLLVILVGCDADCRPCGAHEQTGWRGHISNTTGPELATHMRHPPSQPSNFRSRQPKGSAPAPPQQFLSKNQILSRYKERRREASREDISKATLTWSVAASELSVTQSKISFPAPSPASVIRRTLKRLGRDKEKGEVWNQLRHVVVDGQPSPSRKTSREMDFFLVPVCGHLNWEHFGDHLSGDSVQYTLRTLEIRTASARWRVGERVQPFAMVIVYVEMLRKLEMNHTRLLVERQHGSRVRIL